MSASGHITMTRVPLTRLVLTRRLMGNRGAVLAQKMFGTKRVRDVYVPPRVVNGSSVVMPKN